MSAPTTKERILAEATRQLPKVGYAAFTLTAVREALGLSSGSLFHAYASKPALAAAVYVEGIAAYQAEALAEIRRQRDARQALRALVAVHLGWVEDHRELARYLFATMPDEVMAAADAPLAARNKAFYAEIKALFERAAAADLMAPLDRVTAYALSIGPAHDYCRHWANGRAQIKPRQLSPMFEDAALAALASTRVSTSRKQTRTA